MCDLSSSFPDKYGVSCHLRALSDESFFLICVTSLKIEADEIYQTFPPFFYSNWQLLILNSLKRENLLMWCWRIVCITGWTKSLFCKYNRVRGWFACVNTCYMRATNRGIVFQILISVFCFFTFCSSSLEFKGNQEGWPTKT